MRDLFEDVDNIVGDWKVSNFSANGFFDEEARRELEDKYWKITEITDKFNRQSVSYQLSKKDCLHSWLKYKEGFSSSLVESLLSEFRIKPGELVMDPFMGSGTTALVSIMNGYHCIGFDILPMSKISIQAKSNVYNYDIAELERIRNDFNALAVPDNLHLAVNSLTITKDGYPKETEREIAYYTKYLQQANYSDCSKNLVTLCILNSLEKISYSAKDGQYLRWDYRCPKIIAAAKAREEAGKKPFVVKLDKGDIPSLKTALNEEFSKVLNDIKELQLRRGEIDTKITFIEDSALKELPLLESENVGAVITSPPYCNRYDYTRTYAMELAYLGITDQSIKALRQTLLSCTVESKTKLEALKEYYKSLDRLEDYNKIVSIIENNLVLKEINAALQNRALNGEINNKGILRMVDGYFTELTFIFFELFRVCKKGAKVAFVNDNVRYAGEVIPVDYLTTDLAEQVGFTPVKIYTLKQKKGNSSQQMKKYGRVALRKSITIWQK